MSEIYSRFNPCRNCDILPNIYCFGKVAECHKCRQICGGASYEELVWRWNRANPKPEKSNESYNESSNESSQKKTPYSEMVEMISAIAKTLEEILEQEKLIAAKILKEEKEGRD